MNIKKVEFNDMDLWVLEETNLRMFRIIIDPIEIQDFKGYAWKKHDLNEIIKSIYHPITQNEMIKRQYQILEEPFAVIDALRGDITGEYKKDLVRLQEDLKLCSEEVYKQAYQMDQQP